MFLPLSFPVCVPLSLLRCFSALHAPSLLPLFVTGALPLSLSLPLPFSLSPFLPFSRGLCVKRRSTGALTLSTDRQSIPQQVRTFAREIVIFTVPSAVLAVSISLVGALAAVPRSSDPPFLHSFPQCSPTSSVRSMDQIRTSGSTFNADLRDTYARFYTEFSPLLFSVFLPFRRHLSNGGNGGKREAEILLFLDRGATTAHRVVCIASLESFAGSSTIARLRCRQIFSMSIFFVHLDVASPRYRRIFTSEFIVEISTPIWPTFLSLVVSRQTDRRCTLYKITFA